MLHRTINFTKDGRVNMRTYIHDISPDISQIPKRPAIIVLPGGAYGYIADTEAEPAALTFLKEGFNTFILNYSVGDYSVFPNPLNDVSKAIWEVRKNAVEWGINPEAITVMGFSAGAGIAAMAATQWNTDGLAKRLNIPEGGNKPDAAVIGYGASLQSKTIIDDPAIYKPDFLGKIAKDKTPELDVVNYVGPHTPPLFIWHTRYDKFVPVINPLLMVEAMTKHDRSYELHIFQEGCHGMSVSNNLSSYKDEETLHNPNVGMWVSLCSNWLYGLFDI
jgi:acetyl esterase/lipase